MFNDHFIGGGGNFLDHAARGVTGFFSRPQLEDARTAAIVIKPAANWSIPIVLVLFISISLIRLRQFWHFNRLKELMTGQDRLLTGMRLPATLGMVTIVFASEKVRNGAAWRAAFFAAAVVVAGAAPFAVPARAADQPQGCEPAPEPEPEDRMYSYEFEQIKHHGPSNKCNPAVNEAEPSTPRSLSDPLLPRSNGTWTITNFARPWPPSRMLLVT